MSAWGVKHIQPGTLAELPPDSGPGQVSQYVYISGFLPAGKIQYHLLGAVDLKCNHLKSLAHKGHPIKYFSLPFPPSLFTSKHMD